MLERVRQTVLWVGACLGGLCVLWAAATHVLGLTPLVFTSGSMAPQIAAGDLALAESTPARAVAVGDVVSVVNAAGRRVTHRVVDVDPVDAGSVVLSLKGDANARPDAEAYNVEQVERVVTSVPAAGHVVAAVGTPAGRFAAGAGLGLCLVLLVPWRRGGGPEVSRAGEHRRARPNRARRSVPYAGRGAAVLVALALAAPSSSRAVPTDASFTDDGTLTATSSARTIVSQAQPVCTNVDGVLVLGNIARVTWSQVAADHEYAWVLRRTDNGTAVASGTAGTGQAAGTTVQVDLGTGLIGTNTNYDLVVTARLTSSPTWVAATSTTTPVRRASVLIIGAAFRCGHA